MPTSNFNLPLIDGASPISIVNDMNSLATATDSAMATMATASDIATVKQLAENAKSTAQEANNIAQTAQGSAQTANETAVNAVATANAASATAVAAKNQADTITATFNDTFNFSQAKKITQTGNVSIDLTVLINANKTLFKCYGFIRIKANNSLNLVSIPGSTNYGYKLDVGGALTKASKAIVVSTGGLTAWDNTTIAFSTASAGASIIIGTDGNLYVAINNTSSITVGSSAVYLAQYPACIFINADLGDTPIPTPQG